MSEFFSLPLDTALGCEKANNGTLSLKQKRTPIYSLGEGPPGTSEELVQGGWQWVEITHYLSFEVFYDQMTLKRMAVGTCNQ